MKFWRSLALTLAVIAAPLPALASFGDVSSSHPYASYIQSLQDQGVVDGQNGNFYPERNLSRAELTKIVLLAAKTPMNSSGAERFIDVPAYHSLYTYVQTAAQANIVSGYPDGYFRPDKSVSRGEATKIVFNTLKLSPNLSGAPHFWDVPAGSSFYSFVETLVNKGAITPVSANSFGVDLPITRGEMAKLVVVAQGTTPAPTTVNGLTSSQTSACVVSRQVTVKSEANNVIIQAYVSGLAAAANQPLGVVVKISDLNGRPVPSLQMNMQVVEGDSGSITNPADIGRTGVYVGSYTSSYTGGGSVSPKTTLLITEQNTTTLTRPTGYETVKAIPEVRLSFTTNQSTTIGTPRTFCWDMTRSSITVDPNNTNQYVDDSIVIIGLVEDGNKVGIPGQNLSLYVDGALYVSTSANTGGVYTLIFTPTNPNSNTVAFTRTHNLYLRFRDSENRLFESSLMKATINFLART